MRNGWAVSLGRGSDRVAARLGFRQGFALVGLRLLLARGLVRALQVVALLLGHFVILLGLGDEHLVLGVRRALALGLLLGHGDLLLRLGFLHADVLGVAAHGLARGLVGLVLGLDRLVLGLVVRARRDLGVLDRVGDRAARGSGSGRGARRRRRRGAGLCGCKCRRTEQEGPGQGGVKSGHFHIWGSLCDSSHWTH